MSAADWEPIVTCDAASSIPAEAMLCQQLVSPVMPAVQPGVPQAGALICFLS
jgi:hypothetical protein